MQPTECSLLASELAEAPDAGQQLRLVQRSFSERILGDRALHEIVRSSLGLPDDRWLGADSCLLAPWRLPVGAEEWRMGCVASWLGEDWPSDLEAPVRPLRQASIQLLAVTPRALRGSMVYLDYPDTLMYARPTRRLAAAGFRICLSVGWLVVATRYFLEAAADNPAYSAATGDADPEPAAPWPLSGRQLVAA